MYILRTYQSIDLPIYGVEELVHPYIRTIDSNVSRHTTDGEYVDMSEFPCQHAGVFRLKVEAFLRVASMYEARAESMPRSTTYAGIWNSDVHMLMHMKNAAPIMKARLACRKAVPAKKVI